MPSELTFDPECYLCNGSGELWLGERGIKRCRCDEVLVLHDKLDQYRKLVATYNRNRGD